MKRKIMGISIAAMLIFLIATIGLTFQNEPEGFRDLKWGDAPTEDMIYFATVDEDRGYTISNDKMYIGNAQFSHIVYVFYDQPERLASVGLYFKGEKNFDLLKTICRGKFGEETGSGFFELDWEGQKAYIVLQYDMAEESGYLTLASAQIMLEQMAAQEEQEIEKAEGDW